MSISDQYNILQLHPGLPILKPGILFTHYFRDINIIYISNRLTLANIIQRQTETANGHDDNLLSHTIYSGNTTAVLYSTVVVVASYLRASSK